MMVNCVVWPSKGRRFRPRDRRLLLVATDVTQTREEYDRLRRHSRTDALTGLSSRAAMISTLSSELRGGQDRGTSGGVGLARPRRPRTSMIATATRRGDTALAEVAGRIRSNMGNDPVIIAHGRRRVRPAHADVDHLEQLDFRLDKFVTPAQPAGRRHGHLPRHGFGGIAMFPKDSSTVDGLLCRRHGDVRGQAGGDQFRFPRPGMHAETEQRAQLATGTRRFGPDAVLHTALPTHLRSGGRQGLRSGGIRCAGFPEQRNDSVGGAFTLPRSTAGRFVPWADR